MGIERANAIFPQETWPNFIYIYIQFDEIYLGSTVYELKK